MAWSLSSISGCLTSDDESGYDSTSHYATSDYATPEDDNDVFITGSFEMNYDVTPLSELNIDAFFEQRKKPYVIKKSGNDSSLVIETQNPSGEVKRRNLLNPDRFKTQMCKAYKRGSCLFAEQCQFAHGKEELRAPKVHQKYKTQKCKNFDAGNCKHGNDCWFIHTNDENEKKLTIQMKALSKKSAKEIQDWSSNKS